MERLNKNVFAVASKHCGKLCSTKEVLLRRKTEAEQNQNCPEDQDRNQLYEQDPVVGTDCRPGPTCNSASPLA